LNSSRQAVKTLLVASIQYQAYYLCRFNLATVLPLLISEFTLTHSDAGVLGSVLFLSYAFALIPAGALGDRVGPRLVITVGAFLSLSVNVLFPYSASFLLMLLLQVVNGFGQGMAWGPLTRLMANWYPREKMGFVMSLLSVPAALGPPVAFVLSGYLAAVYGLRSAFQIPAFILAVTSLMFVLCVRNEPRGEPRVRRAAGLAGALQVLRNKGIWLVGFSYLALYGVTRGIMAWLPTLLVEREGFSLMGAASLGGLISLPGIPAMFLGTWISEVKLGGRKNLVIAASLLLSIPVLAFLQFLHDPLLLPWLLGSLFAILNSAGGLYFAYPSLLVSREQVGAGSGLIDMLGYAGIFLITILIGMMVDVFKSYDPVFPVLTLVSLFGAVVILGVKPTHQVTSP